MKRFAFILSIDFLYAGIILFLVFKPTKQPATHGEGTLHGYVYAEWSSDKETEHVFLPGVLITVKDEAGATTNVVKSKSDGSYTTKHLKFGSYKIYLTKTGFPVSWYHAFVGFSSQAPDSLKLNLNSENYSWEGSRLQSGSADY